VEEKDGEVVEVKRLVRVRNGGCGPPASLQIEITARLIFSGDLCLPAMDQHLEEPVHVGELRGISAEFSCAVEVTELVNRWRSNHHAPVCFGCA
jgi:hypothetical protein